MAEMKKYLDTTSLGTLVNQIKAEDAKVLAAAKDHAEGLASNYDAAGAAGTAETNAKAYADEKVKGLADGAVKTNADEIAAIKADYLVKADKETLQGSINGVDAKADANAEAIAAINNAENGILKQAKDYADAEDAKIEQEVADLEAYVGVIPEGSEATNVVAYVQEKTEGIATDAALGELQAAVDAVEADVAVIEGDYLKAADKTELQGKIDAEAERAAGIESGLRTDVDAIKADYLKAADKTALQEQITANANAIEVLTEGIDAEKVDGVKDLIAYVDEHGTEVTGMKEDIAENAEAIEGVAGRATALEGAVATKVEQEAYNTKVAALESADAGQVERIAALEAKFGEGEGNVEDMISDAVADGVADAVAQAEAKDAQVLADAKKYADDEDAKIESRVDALEAASATHALASDLNTLAGRVTAEEGKVATLQEEMDAVEALADAADKAAKANAQAIALKAAQADLDNAVARIAANEGAISTINEELADKAEQDALDAAVARISANETAIAENKSAIGAFTAITSDEVNALFA